MNKMEVDSGAKPGMSSDESARIKVLECGNRELKRANEQTRYCGWRRFFFAQAEFDRKPKKSSVLWIRVEGYMVSSRSAGCCRLHRPRNTATSS